jgi:ubiquinone/menaquinone biosynthesis C-methylase UbiE
VLRAYGWGPLLNLGWFRFRRPFTLLNLVFTSLVLAPRLRLPAAQLGLVKRSIRLLAPDADSAVLDVACGRGAISFTVANVHPQTQVTGVDLLPESVDVARTLYGNAPNLTYRQGDATKLDFADESFDRLLCLEAAFHFPDRAAFLAEARRVLRPGGRVLIVDFMTHDDADPAIWESDEAALVRDTWRFERFSTSSEYRANAAAAGFDVLEMRDWSAHVTEPVQSLFNLVAWLGRRRWGRRVMTIQNPLLHSLSADDWVAFDRASKAHKRLRTSSSYTALVLTPTPTAPR